MQLQPFVSLLPDVLLKSKADNTVKSYISGFNLWKVWSENVEDMIKLSLEKQVNSITGGQLQLFASLLPDILMKSKANNTAKSYISGFNLWRVWSENAEGTPTKPIYLYLLFVSHIQNNSSHNIILKIFYGVRWVHRV